MSATSEAIIEQDTVFEQLAEIITALINKIHASEADKAAAEAKIKALIAEDEANANTIGIRTDRLNALLEAAKNAIPITPMAVAESPVPTSMPEEIPVTEKGDPETEIVDPSAQ